ncbi:hypothetical protein C8A01DRAFT_41580 [Parachaetomium inaequale]|uniref:Uncharacterized protein n=1 Tax=Parachaetomium inaequale TaxID=2588326 RepID=A0AAN6P5D6_9PEZI|nr:hypothetical protein C8A01DRAFT_41580 [Parachaetomium inaequale]
MKRPWAHDTYLQVAAQGEFLTVHEYVSAVHPWLMAMRDTLLDVLGKMDSTPKWPPETKLAILYLGPGPLSIGHAQTSDPVDCHSLSTTARSSMSWLSSLIHHHLLRRASAGVPEKYSSGPRQARWARDGAAMSSR